MFVPSGLDYERVHNFFTLTDFVCVIVIVTVVLTKFLNISEIELAAILEKAHDFQ